MATGIVSVAARLQGLPVLSDALLAMALLGWGLLLLVVANRERPRLESFAFVAATAVLGARFSYAGAPAVACAFWALAVAAWLVLLARRPRLTSANGGWFLVAVATEGLAVVASLLAPRFGEGLLPAALVWWAAGLAVYPLVVSAIALGRLRFEPELWITMGALAIATLAGTELLEAARQLGALGPIRQGLRAADIATWALASAWIAPLAVADALHRAGRRYSPSRWSFVFPLGMYAVATQALGHAAGLGALRLVAHVFFAVALAAWALTLAGLTRRAWG